MHSILGHSHILSMESRLRTHGWGSNIPWDMGVCWGGNMDTWGGLVGGKTRQVRGSDHEAPLVHVEDEHCLVRKGRKEATILRLLPLPR